MTIEVMEYVMVSMFIILMLLLVLLLIPVIVQSYRDTFSSYEEDNEYSIR